MLPSKMVTMPKRSEAKMAVAVWDVRGGERFNQIAQGERQKAHPDGTEHKAGFQDRLEQDEGEGCDAEDDGAVAKGELVQGMGGEQNQQRAEASGKDEAGPIGFAIDQENSGEQGEDGDVGVCEQGIDRVHWKLWPCCSNW